MARALPLLSFVCVLSSRKFQSPVAVQLNHLSLVHLVTAGRLMLLAVVKAAARGPIQRQSKPRRGVSLIKAGELCCSISLAAVSARPSLGVFQLRFPTMRAT